MIRIILLAFLLASCGGDDGGGSSSSSFFSFIGADPYVVDATFFYDQNENDIYDQGELVSAPTDLSGNGSFSTIIPEGGKIIQLTGGTMDGFNYNGRLKGISNGVGNIILSPMTTLIANGYTNDQVLLLLDSAGISINEDQINQNPMESPELLQAALTLSQGLLASIKGYDLAPADISFVEGKANWVNPYAGVLFKQAGVVYKQIINGSSFGNINDLSKTSSSFFTFMNNFGADIFVSAEGAPTNEIANAQEAINNVVFESKNSYEPINLGLISGTFKAEVLKNESFFPGFYDVIGLDFFNLNTRQVKNTISDYPFSPKKIRIDFFGANITSPNSMSVPNDPIKRSWTLKPKSKMVDFKVKPTLTNGQKPTNVQVINGLPISTYDESSSMILRITEFKDTSNPLSEKNLRLVGDGNSIFTYMGVDWGSDPKDPTAWTVNNSRTNNCIIDDMPTADCNQPVTYYYNSQKENADLKSFSSLGHGTYLGSPLPSDVQFKFTVRNLPLGATITETPYDVTISKIELTEAILEKVPCSNPTGCIAVKVGQENTRAPLEDTTDISFLIGYSTFPADYKVYAVNKVYLKLDENEEAACSTASSSSFFKDNMLLLKLNCPKNFPKSEYLFVDLAARIGVAASYEKNWMEGDLVNFKYRDFNRITLKDIQP